MRTSADPVARLERVRRTFKQAGAEIVALDDVSLDVQAGEFLVVLGPSGSGKTTLLHVIAGLLRATSGRVVICGRELTAMSDGEQARLRRRHLGVVFQSFNLLPVLTAAENVALPLLLDGESPQRIKRRVDEALARVGLERRRNHTPDELSGGECQRVALARALVAMPTLVLADEPTGNLDARSGGLVLDLLRDANRSLEQTVILVTHDPAALAQGTRVVQLDDGRLKMGEGRAL